MIPMGLQARDEAKTVGDGETKNRKAKKPKGRKAEKPKSRKAETGLWFYRFIPVKCLI